MKNRLRACFAPVARINDEEQNSHDPVPASLKNPEPRRSTPP
jgi:hypothetical protein